MNYRQLGQNISCALLVFRDDLGLQPGLGNPVVLELDADTADVPKLTELGFDVFTSVDALLGYVNRRQEDTAGGSQPEPVDAAAPSPAAEALEQEFATQMRSLYERAQKEVHYTPTSLLRMLADLGPLAAARKLLNAPAVSDGFAALWERGRLDLTVEALVLQPQFAELFDDQERQLAAKRLAQFGYAAA